MEKFWLHEGQRKAPRAHSKGSFPLDENKNDSSSEGFQFQKRQNSFSTIEWIEITPSFKCMRDFSSDCFTFIRRMFKRRNKNFNWFLMSHPIFMKQNFKSLSFMKENESHFPTIDHLNGVIGLLLAMLTKETIIPFSTITIPQKTIATKQTIFVKDEIGDCGIGGHFENWILGFGRHEEESGDWWWEDWILGCSKCIIEMIWVSIFWNIHQESFPWFQMRLHLSTKSIQNNIQIFSWKKKYCIYDTQWLQKIHLKTTFSFSFDSWGTEIFSFKTSQFPFSKTLIKCWSFHFKSDIINCFFPFLQKNPAIFQMAWMNITRIAIHPIIKSWRLNHLFSALRTKKIHLKACNLKRRIASSKLDPDPFPIFGSETVQTTPFMKSAEEALTRQTELGECEKNRMDAPCWFHSWLQTGQIGFIEKPGVWDSVGKFQCILGEIFQNKKDGLLLEAQVSNHFL